MRRMLLLMLAVGSGCREPAPRPRDGGEPVPECSEDAGEALCDEASQDNVMFTWARAVCGLLLDCCTAPDRSRAAELMLTQQGLALALLKEPALLDDPLACRRAVTLSLLLRSQQHFEALDDHRQRFNREEARACLAWAQQGAALCAPGLLLLDEAHQPRACKRMFAPNVEADAGCYEDPDCVAAPDGGRSICETRTALLDDGGIFFSFAGTCRPLHELGERCPLPDGDCGTDRFCAADQTCHARAALDEVCLASPCDAQTFCDTTRQPPACTLRRGNFEPCATAAECRQGYACNVGLSACLEAPELSPLDVTFDFCLGDQDHRVARELPFVPADGGL